MREFESSPITLNKGLKPFKGSRNTDYLIDCHNVMPMEGGLEIHEVLTDVNADGVTWGGLGKVSSGTGTKTITINVHDYVSGLDVATVAVYLDNVSKGNTDGNGEITIASVAVGGHTLKLTKAGYSDSDADDLIFNDYIMVI